MIILLKEDNIYDTDTMASKKFQTLYKAGFKITILQFQDPNRNYIYKKDI